MENWPATLGYRIDFFTIFTLLGVVQGLFLSFFFLIGSGGRIRRNRYLGVILLGMSMVILEIFLCYSGYIVHFPHLVDYSEPINFLITPLIYLMVANLAGKHPSRWYWHLLPFVGYLLYHFCFLFQSETFKLNAFRHSYHPHLRFFHIPTCYL